MISGKDMKYLVEKVLMGFEDSGQRRGWYTEDAVMLVLRTGATESRYYHLRQKLSKGRIGVARGLFQIEPSTARSIIKNYIAYRPSIKGDIERICMCDLSKIDDPEENAQLELQLMGNNLLSIGLCRVRYRPYPARIPPAIDIVAQADYWLKAYNRGGKGTINKFVTHAKRLKVD